MKEQRAIEIAQEVRTTFKLKKFQDDFIFSEKMFPAFVGAVGTGKSMCLINRGIVLSQESPNNLGVIVRKSFTDLRDSTLKDFELYTGLSVKKDAKEVELPNGSVIMFRHGDELPTLKNINLGWFAIEQAEEFLDDTPYQFLKMRLRRQVARRSGFLIANASGHNWIWKRFIEPTTLGKEEQLVQASTYENLDVLPADYLDTLKSLSKPLYKRYVENSHEEIEGLVYSEFSTARHVIDPIEIPETWETGFGLDHGFRNPTAVLWYTVDFDGNLIFYDEHYEKEKPISYHAEQIKLRGLTSGICDPSIFNRTISRKDKIFSLADEYRDCGIKLRAAYKSKEDASIARVNEFFKADRIKITRNCTSLIREVSNWLWKAPRPGQELNAPETPMDLNNHGADVIKYVVTSRFQSTVREKVVPISGASLEAYIQKDLNTHKRRFA